MKKKRAKNRDVMVAKGESFTLWIAERFGSTLVTATARNNPETCRHTALGFGWTDPFKVIAFTVTPRDLARTAAGRKETR